MCESIKNIKLAKKITKHGNSKVVEINETSTCKFLINFLVMPESYESKYMTDKKDEPQQMSIGNAMNLIDWAIEKFLLTMTVNEKCYCIIEGEMKVRFELSLLETTPGLYYFELPLLELWRLVQTYKENGLKCYNTYPWLAHEYFSVAAKCLLTHLPHLNSEEKTITDSISVDEVTKTFETLSSNIAACLLKEQRYKDVIEILAFVNDQTNPNEKYTFRLATAYINTKKFEQAKHLLEKFNYGDSKSLSNLYEHLISSMKSENEKYAAMVKKMFP